MLFLVRVVSIWVTPVPNEPIKIKQVAHDKGKKGNQENIYLVGYEDEILEDRVVFVNLFLIVVVTDDIAILRYKITLISHKVYNF